MSQTTDVAQFHVPEHVAHEETRILFLVLFPLIVLVG
jgi:hypothetical protein